MLLTAIRSDRFSEVLPGVSDSTGHSIRHSYVRVAHKRHAVTRGQHPLSISGNLGNILTPFGAKRVMSLRHGECDPARVCVCVCCSIILRSAQSQRSLLSTTGSSLYLAHS